MYFLCKSCFKIALSDIDKLLRLDLSCGCHCDRLSVRVGFVFYFLDACHFPELLPRLIPDCYLPGYTVESVSVFVVYACYHLGFDLSQGSSSQFGELSSDVLIDLGIGILSIASRPSTNNLILTSYLALSVDTDAQAYCAEQCYH